MSEKGSYYARVLGTFWRHPRTLGLSMAARGLWVSLLSWSADQRSDGGIPAPALTMVCGGKPDARSLQELILSGLLVQAESAYLLRDWAQHNITRDEHEQAKEATRKRVADHRRKAAVTPDVTRYTDRTETRTYGVTSEQEQEQEQEQDSDRESDARAKPVAPDAGTPKAASLTERAERVRVTLRGEYQRRGLVVPTMDLSIPHSGHVLDLTRAFDGRGDLGSCLDGFFSDDRAAAAGFPVAWLAKNPNAYLAKRPRNAKNPRANSEYRDRVLTMDELLDGAKGATNG